MGTRYWRSRFQGQLPTFFERASDAQLEWVSPLAEWAAEEADCRIAIGADTNTHELSDVDPERQTKRRAATRELMEVVMQRSAEGGHRWVYTLFPTDAYAADAEMSLARFEDFYFAACLADEPDSVDAWARASEECARLAEWIEGHEEVRVTAPGTDIRLGIAGRKFIAADGKRNMPDGEFFTAPIEDSVNGEVTFHLPAMVGGREVAGVRLRFEAGKVVDASAERGEEYLISLLDTDEGARRLGELGIGTNYAIDRGTRNVLLDEKIGGTVHMAVGAGYPECGGDNRAPSTRTWSATCAAAGGSRSTASRSRRTGASWSEASGSRRPGPQAGTGSKKYLKSWRDPKLSPAVVVCWMPHRSSVRARASRGFVPGTWCRINQWDADAMAAGPSQPGRQCMPASAPGPPQLEPGFLVLGHVRPLEVGVDQAQEGGHRRAPGPAVHEARPGDHGRRARGRGGPGGELHPCGGDREGARLLDAQGQHPAGDRPRHRGRAAATRRSSASSTRATAPAAWRSWSRR